MQIIKKIYKAFGIGAIMLALGSCTSKEARFEMNFPEKFEGKTVELVNYADSTVVATTVVKDGVAQFVTEESDSLSFPVFMSVAVDGRIKAFYIAEPGRAVIADSLSVAKGTPLNDKFSSLMATLDSIEQTDDMTTYSDFTERAYNENRENPIGIYFGIEWLKYADPAQADSMLAKADETFRKARRVKYYEDQAHRRAATSPGQKYVDFQGENAKGRKVSLSQFVKPGQYTLIDFWASWCPYCIKELPDLKSLYDDFKDKGFNIVGVAVRDKAEDTRAMVKKRDIKWDVVYNTQKVPYDIYGFSGIPHHMLIGPDGVIISRGENAEQIRKRLETAFAAEN